MLKLACAPRETGKSLFIHAASSCFGCQMFWYDVCFRCILLSTPTVTMNKLALLPRTKCPKARTRSSQLLALLRHLYLLYTCPHGPPPDTLLVKHGKALYSPGWIKTCSLREGWGLKYRNAAGCCLDIEPSVSQVSLHATPLLKLAI